MLLWLTEGVLGSRAAHPGGDGYPPRQQQQVDKRYLHTSLPQIFIVSLDAASDEFPLFENKAIQRETSWGIQQ